MDFETYHKKYYADPQPKSKFDFSGILGATLYYKDYQEALAFYTKVFGPPNYIEGEFTHGWKIGQSWLTLFPSKEGNPTNVEVPFYMESPKAVDKLFEAFRSAGAEVVQEPTQTLMYQPVHIGILNDPFGVTLMIVCTLPK